MGKEKVRLSEDGEFLPVLTPGGAEIPDPRPMAPPVGFKRQPPLHERIRAMVQHEFELARARQEVESPAEADDFDVDDDVDPDSPYEHHFDAPKDEDELFRRLIDAGWTPPQAERGQGRASTDVQPKVGADSPSLDAAERPDNGPEPAPPADGKRSLKAQKQ